MGHPCGGASLSSAVGRFTRMAPRSRNLFPVPLLFMWGVMGTMVGCCVLWGLWSVGSETVTLALELSRRLLSRVNITLSPLAAVAVLHLQFGGGGFIIGS